MPSGSIEGHILTLIALPVEIKQDGWHNEYTIAYTDYKKISNLVSDICKKRHPGFKTQIENTPAIEDLSILIQYGQTDIQFIKYLAELAGGYEFTIKANTVIFRKSDPVDAPIVTLEYGKNIISYELEETDQADASETETYGEQAGNTTELQVTKKDVAKQRKADDQKADDFIGEAVDVMTPYSPTVYSPFHSPKIRENIAKAATKQAATEKVRMNISVCDPEKNYLLRAGKTVLVKGLGYFDGKYYINPSAKHRWSESYEVDLQLTNYQATQ